MARRWFGRNSCTIDTEQIFLQTNTMANCTLNTHRVLTDLDLPGSFVNSLAPIGSAPNANAGVIAAGVLTLEPANASFGGLVTTGAQTFAGAKTFQGNVITPQVTIPTSITTSSASAAPLAIDPSTHNLSTLTYGTSSSTFTPQPTSGTITTFQVRGSTTTTITLEVYRMDNWVFLRVPAFTIVATTGAPTTIALTGLAGSLPGLFSPDHQLDFLTDCNNTGSPGRLTVRPPGSVQWQLFVVGDMTGYGTVGDFTCMWPAS